MTRNVFIHAIYSNEAVTANYDFLMCTWIDGTVYSCCDKTCRCLVLANSGFETFEARTYHTVVPLQKVTQQNHSTIGTSTQHLLLLDPKNLSCYRNRAKGFIVTKLWRFYWFEMLIYRNPLRVENFCVFRGKRLAGN